MKFIICVFLIICVLFTGCHSFEQIENSDPAQEIEATTASDTITSDAAADSSANQNENTAADSAETTTVEDVVASSETDVSDDSEVEISPKEESAPADAAEDSSVEAEATDPIEPTTDIEETTAAEDVAASSETDVSDNSEAVVISPKEESAPADAAEDSSVEAEATEPIEPTTAIEETTASEIPATMELAKIGELQYYLYSPENPTDDMPLIIYLHGGTNKKADVEELLTTDGFPKYLYDGYYGDLRAYVAVPKLSNEYKGWADVYEQIRNLIKDLSTNYGISMSKVSLTGHSMGGTGTYQLQVKLPNTFACIAPMSGSIRNTEENLAALSKTKIWAFIGTNDTIVEPESSRTIISELKELGATAKITELNDATHFDVPALAYKNDDLIDWLVNCGN